MSKTGLAETPEGTTPAPGMYREIEQSESVARGHVEVVEIIAYDFIRTRKNEAGKEIPVEKGREPYFCQTKEQEQIFKGNNPDVRMETFHIQLLKSTAIKYLDSPRNMKQFKEKQDGRTSSSTAS